MTMPFLDELEARGLLQDVSHRDELANQRITAPGQVLTPLWTWAPSRW